MNARDALNIATAALRWQTARELRLAAGAEKRRADVAYGARWDGDIAARLNAGHRATVADAAVAETRRQERAAVRALTKACARARSEMHQATDVSATVLELA